MTHLKREPAERIVIKIGTESLFGWENGEFGGKKVEILCSDISHLLHKTSTEVILVTSWAVGFGKKIMKERDGVSFDGLVANQYLASIGQSALMVGYDEYFARHSIKTGQVLVTHADIEDDKSREESVRKVLEYHLCLRTLPIVNENDTASSEELQALGRGADNDQNALLIARLVGAKTLYIITNTNGVYRDKDNPHSRIKTIGSSELTSSFIERITGGKSEHGTGGMYSKLEVAREAIKFGIETRIIDGITSTIGNYDHRKWYAGTSIEA